MMRRLWADPAWAGVVFWLGGRDPKRLEALAQEARGFGIGARPWYLDLEQPLAFHESSGVFDQLGPVRGLALVAGINHDQPVATLSAEQWDKLWAVDFASHARLLASLGRLGRFAPDASALLVGSIMGHRGNAGQAAYAAAKGALHDLMYQAPAGLRINLLLPPLVESPLLAHLSSEARESLFNMRSMEDPDPALSCAEAAAFLLSPAASYVHRQVLHADSRVTALGWVE